MRIVIGADTAALGRDAESFIRGDAEKLVGSGILETLKSADLRVFDLEAPLAEKVDPIKKFGPVLCSPSIAAKGFEALGIDALTMANNHIMDQGSEGLYASFAAIREYGAAFFGAGEDIKSASRPFVAERGGIRVGFIGCAEHEFSIASDSTPGAAPYDPVLTPQSVKELKASCDRVIVLYHGGKELYRYPSPGLMNACRSLCRAGADAVICQHSHCIGCKEEYEGSLIVYGQGDFIFDHSDGRDYEGLLIVLDITKQSMNADFIPYYRKDIGVAAAEGAHKERILEAFGAASERIKDQKTVEKLYSACAEENFAHYFKCMTGRGNGLLHRALNKLFKGLPDRLLLKRRANEKTMLAWKNFFEDEAHRELILRAVSDRLEK
ncbi:MAG: CapA family protein [Clostridia bacterium]|nr:CapA family protein [Clostridia bacterium]